MIGTDFKQYFIPCSTAVRQSAAEKKKKKTFINMLLERFQAPCYPDQHLALDEMVFGWSGRWKHTQYNPSMPWKYHVKVFCLVESNAGYILNLLFYFGAEISYTAKLDKASPQAVKVFESLLNPFSSGHHIYSDRYYTSYNLVDFFNRKI